MDKTYTRIYWQNESVSQTTPLGATNLNTIDYAVDEIDNRVISLDITKTNEAEALTMLSDVEYNTETGVFTFTRKNGTQIIADINIEKIPVGFSMSEDGIITMTTSDGSTYTADVGSMIKAYDFEDSSTVDFEVTTNERGDKSIKANIIDGSITQEKMNPDYLTSINASVQAAASSATAASTSASTATEKATDAEASALLAESWTVGGTGTRYNEDINNAKYWCQQAESKSGIGTGNLIFLSNGQSVESFNANSKENVMVELADFVAYESLQDKPSLNGVEISGDKTTEDYGIQAGMITSTYEDWITHEHGEEDDGKQVIITDLKYIGIYDAENDTLTPVSNQPLEYTLEDWEGIYHDDIADGTQIIITDDYSSTICSTISECEASESVDDVAGASALNELYGKGLKELWSNPNPANDIADGYTISLNSVDYDFLVVQYFVTKTEWTNGFKRSLSVFTTKGCGFMCSYAYASTSGVVSLVRGVKYTNDGLYTTQNCTQSIGASTYTTQNGSLIPYKIYGGKF